MAYWLIKSEPGCFSIDDLKNSPKKTTHWDGVRNYQARNMLRDELKKGDLCFFYHSNAEPPGIAGVCEVVKEGYPDFTAFDPDDKHFDPKSDPEKPRWFMVDVKFKQKFKSLIALAKLRDNPKLATMRILQKGNRLSVTPVTKQEWDAVLKMAG